MDPASALYGGNALGGVIRLESAPPPAAPIATEVVAAGGSDGLLRLQSTTGGTSGAVGYVFDLSRQEYGGFRDFSDAVNLRAAFRSHADTRWGRFGVVGHAVDYEAQNPGSLSDSLLRVDRTQAFANNVRQRTGEEGRQAQLGAFWRPTWNRGDAEVTIYGLGRNIDNPIPPSIIDLERKAGGARGLVRFEPRVPWEARLVAGVELDLQRDQRINFANQQGDRGRAASISVRGSRRRALSPRRFWSPWRASLCWRHCGTTGSASASRTG